MSYALLLCIELCCQGRNGRAGHGRRPGACDVHVGLQRCFGVAFRLACSALPAFAGLEPEGRKSALGSNRLCFVSSPPVFVDPAGLWAAGKNKNRQPDKMLATGCQLPMNWCFGRVVEWLGVVSCSPYKKRRGSIPNPNQSGVSFLQDCKITNQGSQDNSHGAGVFFLQDGQSRTSTLVRYVQVAPPIAARRKWRGCASQLAVASFFRNVQTRLEVLEGLD